MPRLHNESPSSRLPIPSYEEATSSRPSSSQQSLRGPQEVSDDAERQRLLGILNGYANGTTHPARTSYRPPTARSVHSSEDEDSFTGPEASSDEEEDLRQDMEQMDVIDPDHSRTAQQRARLRSGFSKRIASLTETFSSLHLPSFSSLRSRIPSIPYQYRPGWPIIARVVALLLICAIVYALVLARMFHQARAISQFTPQAVQTYIQSAVNRDNIRQFLRQISYDDHIAGTRGDFFLSDYIENHFQDSGLDVVERNDYQVYLNYPRSNGRRVAIVDPPDLAWEARLEEDEVRQQFDSKHPSKRHQTLVFHGHSKTGNVTGPLIYANYGSRKDFAFLKAKGIDVKDSIVLVRYYGTQGDRALKVRAAELAGAKGCLIYTDPQQDGFGKGMTWPQGRWRPGDSVQRGAVSLMSWVVGDVLTPGWASTPGAERLSIEDNPGLVNIPSLPLAWRDAQNLLRALKSKGMKLEDDWKGSVPEIDWWSGNASTSPIVHLMNIQDEVEKRPIRNIIGKIYGIENREKMVYIGNHRDSWCFGSVDPGSGTAVMMEVVRLFGQLRQIGWRPRRTIVFASWDAEEYNLIGSTEHVEDNLDEMRQHGIGYINLDTVVYGQEFWAAASPVFIKALSRVLAGVGDPMTNDTLWRIWQKRGSSLEGLGAGSDYVAFQDLAGCSSIDLGFRTKIPASFPYHSCYETFEWVQKFGDPGFHYHVALAQVAGLLILQLADEDVVPFDLEAYGYAIQDYIRKLQDDSRGESSENEPKLDVGPLQEAARIFLHNAVAFDKWENERNLTLIGNGYFETPTQQLSRFDHNARMANFETHLLDLPDEEEEREGGVPGRTQFKHVIFGPQAWAGYEEAYFPAVRDAMDEENWEQAQEMVKIAARVLKAAADKLLH